MSDSVHLKERIVFEHQEVCEECFKTDLASLSLLVDAGWKKAGVGGVDGMADHVLFWRPTWQGHGRAREAEDGCVAPRHLASALPSRLYFFFFATTVHPRPVSAQCACVTTLNTPVLYRTTKLWPSLTRLSRSSRPDTRDPSPTSPSHHFKTMGRTC